MPLCSSTTTQAKAVPPNRTLGTRQAHSPRPRESPKSHTAPHTPTTSPLTAASPRHPPLSSYDFGLEYLEQLGFLEPQPRSLVRAQVTSAAPEGMSAAYRRSVEGVATPATASAAQRGSRSHSVEPGRLPFAVGVEIRRPLSPRSYRARLAEERAGSAGRKETLAWGVGSRSLAVRNKKRRPQAQARGVAGRGEHQSSQSWQHAECGRMTMTCNFSEASSTQASARNTSSAGTPSSRQSHVYILYS